MSPCAKLERAVFRFTERSITGARIQPMEVCTVNVEACKRARLTLMFNGGTASECAERSYGRAPRVRHETRR